MPPPRRRRPATLIAFSLVLCAALLVVAAPALAARPFIHAHRGGSLEFGKPTYPENTLPAFRASAFRGFVLELDVKLTKDLVPVVIHDATLDRTTPCSGQVRSFTFAELGRAARRTSWARARTSFSWPPATAAGRRSPS